MLDGGHRNCLRKRWLGHGWLQRLCAADCDVPSCAGSGDRFFRHREIPTLRKPRRVGHPSSHKPTQWWPLLPEEEAWAAELLAGWELDNGAPAAIDLTPSDSACSLLNPDLRWV